jgi:hypothetical protein
VRYIWLCIPGVGPSWDSDDSVHGNSTGNWLLSNSFYALQAEKGPELFPASCRDPSIYVLLVLQTGTSPGRSWGLNTKAFISSPWNSNKSKAWFSIIDPFYTL